jgi:hypothetical protein
VRDVPWIAMSLHVQTKLTSHVDDDVATAYL